LEATDLRDISGMSRKDIALCVQLSFDDPVATLGRPRTQAVGGVVQKMVVFQEAHADGDKHFHVAVQLQKSRSFAPAKTTLRTRNLGSTLLKRAYAILVCSPLWLHANIGQASSGLKPFVMVPRLWV